jgi:cytoskeletal protein RodZ
VTDTQKDEVEKNIRYQMMTLMRSGLLENELVPLEHARYLSPIVVMDEQHYGSINSASKQYFQQGSVSSGMTVTQSLLIIAACVAVIGTVGLILTVKVIFRDEEEPFSSVKQQETMDESDSMIPQPSRRYERRRRHQTQQVDSNDASASSVQEDCNSNKTSLNDHQETTERDSSSSSRGNVWGTTANLSTTMRRMIVTKKAPVTRARSGDLTNLGALIEEDEEMPNARDIE